jgi:hypothetical protein
MPMSTRRRLDKWLWVERAANVGIVVVACLLLWNVRSRFSASGQPHLVEVGDQVTIKDALDRDTVLVVFRTGCKYCLASLPFYRQLADLRVRDGLVFVSPPGEARASAALLEEAGIRSVRLLTADFAANRFLVTPLVLSVDSRHTVRAVWRGQLSESDEVQVRKTLAREGEPALDMQSAHSRETGR